MERLVQDLVDDRDRRSSGLALEQRRSDLAAIVREQIEVASARTKRRHIVLDAPDRLDCFCDGIRIAEVVANLLNNALKYSSKGEIHVSVDREGRHARVTVRDAGPGIPAESLRTIFEPRIRLETAHSRRRTSPAPDGAGLGLSIARDIVEAHGGRIWAESNPGEGATFNMVIPTTGRRVSRQHAAIRGSAGT
jgi:signal transduction histidine kinase